MHLGMKENNRLSVFSIQDAVYYEIKKGIMSLKLEPGMLISTQEIATKLNVSRTPVREAFIKLQKEGLVDSIPKVGTIVSKINLDRVEEERSLRETLELAIIEIFVNKCTGTEIEELQKQQELQLKYYENGESFQCVQADNAFHKTFFDRANRRLFWDVLVSNNGHYDRIRVLTIKNPQIALGAFEQHKQMINCIKNGDLQNAKNLLRNHVTKINYEKIDIVNKNRDYFGTTNSEDYKQVGSI